MALGRPEPTQRAGRGGGPPACQGPPHRVYSLGPGAAGSPPRKLQDRVSAPPGTTGACDLLGSHSCLCPPGRGTKGCWLRPRPAEAWAVAQGASGRPSPLLTPALQLGLWSLRWHAWLGSPAAEAAEGSRGLPLRRAGWAESLSGQKHTEQVGDAGRPSGTASRPFLSSPNTREEREPWDGGLPCSAQPPEQQRPTGRADHPQERGRGHLWASPTMARLEPGPQALPRRGRGRAPMYAWPLHEHAGQHTGAHTAAAGSRGTFGQELRGLRCWGALAALGRGLRILLGPHPEASSLDPLPGPASEAPVDAEGGVCLPPVPPLVALPDGQEGKGAWPPGVGVS